MDRQRYDEWERRQELAEARERLLEEWGISPERLEEADRMEGLWESDVLDAEEEMEAGVISPNQFESFLAYRIEYHREIRQKNSAMVRDLEERELDDERGEVGGRGERRREA